MVIDSDYRGPIIVALHNDTETDQIVSAQSRIAQFIISPVPTVDYVQVRALNETERGEGGFGSTGIK